MESVNSRVPHAAPPSSSGYRLQEAGSTGNGGGASSDPLHSRTLDAELLRLTVQNIAHLDLKAGPLRVRERDRERESEKHAKKLDRESIRETEAKRDRWREKTGLCMR